MWYHGLSLLKLVVYVLSLTIMVIGSHDPWYTYDTLLQETVMG